MKIKSAKKYFFLLFIILLVLYLFWGPLFPWSPVKIGYKKIESSKATVFITDFEGKNVAFNLEDLLVEEEKFHGMEFRKRFKIIILGEQSNMKRYLPWLKGSGYSVKLGFVNVIYIGATARSSPYGINVYLKHEISHLLIHQNTSSGSNNMEIQRQGWLTEGVATYYGGPHFYNKKEFIDLWTNYGLAFNNLYEENPLKMGDQVFSLKYTYYRFFIEFLIENYGIEKFQSYLRSYTEDPKRYKMIFPEVFEEDLDEVLTRFDAYIKL